MTQGKDRLEFYLPEGLLAAVYSSVVPTVGAYVSIHKMTYVVRSVTFAVDHADDYALASMRANIDVEKVGGEK